LLPLHNWESKLRSPRSYPVNIGDQIEVIILSISPGNRHLRLRMAQPEMARRNSLPEGIEMGDRLIGIVTERFYHGIRFSLIERSDPDPAASPVASGLTGTVVNTELSWEGQWYYGGGDAREFPLEIGDRSEVLVTGINRVTGEIDLSIKKLTNDPGVIAIKQLRPGVEAYGVVRGRRANRWRVRLEPWSITISMTARPPLQDQVHSGVRVLVRIQQVNLGKRMIRSSLIQIVEDPDENATHT
jgi:ribosomal protein S1